MVRPFVWGLLLVLVVAAGNVLFFSSRWARESAADLLRGELSDALGREVALGSVDFNLWTLTPSFELNDLVIPGPSPRDPAVLRLSGARARITWRALARRRLQIEQLDLERPQIYLRFNPDGSNNLPRLRRPAANQPQRVQLAVDQLLIENGTFQLNERRARLDLTASALWARLSETASPASAVGAKRATGATGSMGATGAAGPVVAGARPRPPPIAGTRGATGLDFPAPTRWRSRPAAASTRTSCGSPPRGCPDRTCRCGWTAPSAGMATTRSTWASGREWRRNGSTAWAISRSRSLVRPTSPAASPSATKPGSTREA